MSAANYYHCPICGFKALYDPSDEVGREVQVLHQDCFTKVNACLDAAVAVVKVWREWGRGTGKVAIPVKALAVAVDVLAVTPAAEALRGELAAEDTTAIQPCQPIGCDNGYHLAGCRFADIDAAEPSATEAGHA